MTYLEVTMQTPEIEKLADLTERAQEIVREGTAGGLRAMRALDRQLVKALDDAAATAHASEEYREGVRALSDIRAAVYAEKVITAISLDDSTIG